MADYDALKESETLRDRANALEREIAVESDLLEKACRLAKQAISLIQQSVAENNAHTERLSMQSREAYKRYEKTFTLYQELVELGNEIDGNMGLMQMRPLYLVKEKAEITTFPVLPDFSAPDRNALEKTPVSPRYHQMEAWKELAAGESELEKNHGYCRKIVAAIESISGSSDMPKRDSETSGKTERASVSGKRKIREKNKE